MQNDRILLVEDDRATQNVLVNTLIAQYYKVDLATDGRSALDLVEICDYDLVILDIGIPKLDGVSVCKQLRNRGYTMPVLLLTAHDLTSDRVLGLNAGADDYMVKPFNLLELLAWVRALLRRGQGKVVEENVPDLITWGELQLDRPMKEISYGGNLLRLTPKEYGILELLLLNPQRIFNRATLLDLLWEMEDPPTESAISSHIKAIRQKLRVAGASQDLIETMYGFGYRLRSLASDQNQQKPELTSAEKSGFEDRPNLSLPEISPKISPKISLEPQPLPDEAATTAMMLELWERFKDSFQEQLVFLEQVITTFRAGQITPELQQETKQTVHKLVGSLGIFGFPQGSSLAKEMEMLLSSETPLLGTAIEQMAALTTALQREIKQKPVFSHSESSGERAVDRGNARAISPPQKRFPLVLVVDDDRFLTEHLQIEATRRSLWVEIAPSPQAAQKLIAKKLPDLVLLDLTFEENSETGWQWLVTLHQQHPNLPVLVFTSRDSLTDRIMAVRLGAKAFLQKPVTNEEIFQVIQTTLEYNQLPEPPIAGKIMAVDDDPMILHQLSALLLPWGLQVKPLLEPSLFWQVLTDTAPDLLMLDIEMPGFSGMELCQVVRNDPQWEHLPILFLTAHQEPEIMVQAFASGGDDYIRKPFLAPELIVRVLHRLQPGQVSWQQLMLTFMEKT